MEFKHSHISGLVEIIPAIFTDERGFFFESYSKKKFEENGVPFNFIQDNQSYSIKNVIRGLHFQKGPYAQGKLVRVIKGKAVDVVVDIRKGSPTFGQWQSFLLDGEKNNMVYVPEGFAHGFAALEDTILQYKCTNLYNKSSEGGIRWDDPDLTIDWEVKNPIISEKDEQLGSFKECLA